MVKGGQPVVSGTDEILLDLINLTINICKINNIICSLGYQNQLTMRNLSVVFAIRLSAADVIQEEKRK